MHERNLARSRESLEDIYGGHSPACRAGVIERLETLVDIFQILVALTSVRIAPERVVRFGKPVTGLGVMRHVRKAYRGISYGVFKRVVGDRLPRGVGYRHTFAVDVIKRLTHRRLVSRHGERIWERILPAPLIEHSVAFGVLKRKSAGDKGAEIHVHDLISGLRSHRSRLLLRIPYMPAPYDVAVGVARRYQRIAGLAGRLEHYISVLQSHRGYHSGLGLPYEER